jgi:hypothetical protein
MFKYSQAYRLTGSGLLFPVLVYASLNERIKILDIYSTVAFWGLELVVKC